MVAFLIIVIPVDVQWDLLVVLIHLSLITIDVEHLFICVFAIVFCLWWHFWSNNLPTRAEGRMLELLLLNFEISLCIVDRIFFSNIYFFPQCVVCVLVLLAGFVCFFSFFLRKYILIVMKSKSFICFIMCHTLVSRLRNLCPTQGHEIVSYFTSKKLIAFCFNFRAMIHVELISLYGVSCESFVCLFVCCNGYPVVPMLFFEMTALSLGLHHFLITELKVESHTYAIHFIF